MSMPAPTVAFDTPIEWSTIIVSGPQAEEFLQGQLSQDLSGLGRQPVDSLLLMPDSVVVTSCRVARVDDRFEMVVERLVAETARSRLARFKLRTQCAIDLRDGGDGRFDSVGARVVARWPGAPEFARDLAPHSFGRSFIDSTVSFAKGCFTGQELVGRLDARDASVPWRLVGVSGPDAATVDEVVRRVGPAGPQGVTSAVERDGRVLALAIAHRRLVAEDLGGGVEVSEVT